MPTAVPVRLICVPHKPTAAATVALSVALSSPSTTLNSSDAAHLTVGAANDIWHPIHYLRRVVFQMRAWLKSAMTGDPNLEPHADVTTINIKGSLTLSATAGASRFVITLTSLNSTPASTITSVTLDNTGGYLTPLGFEDGVSTLYNAVGGVVTMTGDFQPRTLFVFPDYTSDTGDRKIKSALHSHPAADGDVFLYDAGSSYDRRDFSLVDQSTEFCGPSFPVGTWAGWGSNRDDIDLENIDETVVSGLSGIYNDTSTLDFSGKWVSIGNIAHACRVKDFDSTAIEFFDSFPSNVTGVVGDEVRVISEAAALQLEAERIGTVILHSMNDAAGTPRYGAYSVYAPFSEGKSEERHERHSLNDPLYSWAYPLLKRRKTNLTLT